MRRRPLRLRLHGDSLEVVDPGFGELPLIQDLDPAWSIQSAPLLGFREPRLLGLRTRTTGVAVAAFAAATLDDLWAAHDAALERGRPGGVSVLALKAEIARRLLGSCVLCIRRCGVDRTSGARGPCGLGPGAAVAEHYVHIGEEPQVNPSLMIATRGCGLRCRGCQQHDLLDPRTRAGEALGPALWKDLDFAGARSLSFVGGNPDESLPAILDFLNAAPANFALPVVWNNAGAMSPEAMRVLRGLPDVYIPDLKFHREVCAGAYTRVDGYAAAARAGVARLAEDDVPVLVRLLLMPGHAACCHIPSLAWLSSLEAPNLMVSLRAQYAPDWKIGRADGALAGRVSAAEREAVTAAARALGLALVDRETG